MFILLLSRYLSLGARGSQQLFFGSTSVDGLSPNLMFFTGVLSIGARLVEESGGTFHFDNWAVHVKGSTKALKFLLLKSSKAKSIAPT